MEVRVLRSLKISHTSNKQKHTTLIQLIVFIPETTFYTNVNGSLVCDIKLFEILEENVTRIRT